MIGCNFFPTVKLAFRFIKFVFFSLHWLTLPLTKTIFCCFFRNYSMDLHALHRSNGSQFYSSTRCIKNKTVLVCVRSKKIVEHFKRNSFHSKKVLLNYSSYLMVKWTIQISIKFLLYSFSFVIGRTWMGSFLPPLLSLSLSVHKTRISVNLYGLRSKCN